MAVPRIFISSTCYDLKEVRFQIRNFIEDFGYTPVMSDFGDIFYDFNEHVQESCKNEIEKSDIFVLIIGNNYGSIYHKEENKRLETPDSVTLQEFRRALETKIPKYIFINKFTKYDYDNYERALNKYIHKYFNENTIENEKIEETKEILKKDFDNTYPFPHDSYKYIFYFIQAITKLELNNAIYTFESFDNIKNDLRKQWAGLLYSSLKRENTIGIEKIQKIEDKIDKIDKYLKNFVENKNDEVSFNIEDLKKNINIDNVIEIKDKLHEALFNIIKVITKDYMGNNYTDVRFYVIEKFDKKSIELFIKNAKVCLKEYKWSKEIPLEDLIKDRKLYNFYKTISYSVISDFLTLIDVISVEELDNLYNTIANTFNSNYRENEKDTEDEIPF